MAQVLFPVPTWCLTAICNYSPRGIKDCLFQALHTCGAHMYMQANHHTHTIAMKVSNNNSVLINCGGYLRATSGSRCRCTPVQTHTRTHSHMHAHAWAHT